MGTAQRLARTQDVLSLFISSIQLKLEDDSGLRFMTREERSKFWPYTGTDMVVVIYDPALCPGKDRLGDLPPASKLLTAHLVEGNIECYLHRVDLRAGLWQSLRRSAQSIRTPVRLSIDIEQESAGSRGTKHQLEYHVETFSP